jgi:hypothetical protein
METYRTATTVSDDGTLIIRGLPFRPGDKVEVIVRSRKRERRRGDRYPLRGKLIRYVNPYESVAENDWAVLK